MNPLRVLLDPVTTKELSGISRRWQTYAARGLYIALFGIIVWNNSTDLRGDFDPRYSQSVFANMGQRIAMAFLPLQAALVLLSAVSAASDLVTREVRMGTLALLGSTPLTPWRIAAGKWKAATVQALTLLICGAPILGICSSLGGITPRDIVVVLVLSAAGAALGAALSLYCSSLFRSGTTALLTAAVLFGGVLIFPIVVLDDPSVRTIEFAFIAQVHLLCAFMGSLKTPLRPPLQDSWIPACAVTLGLALLFIRLTAARIATLTVRMPQTPLVTRAFDSLDRFYEGIGPEKIRRVRFFVDRGGVWENAAILWKELRTRASGRLRNGVRIALVLTLLLAFSVRLELRQLWIPAFTTSVLLWFLALANGASLFVKEKEERKWDILLATPLRSGDILIAKLLAGIVPLLPMAATIVLFWSMLFATGLLQVEDLGPTLFAIVLPAILAYMVGAACSLKARSLRAAFVLALIVVLGIVLGVPWVLSGMFDQEGYYTSRAYRYEQQHPMNPLRILEAVLDHGRGSGYWYSTVARSHDTGVLVVVYLALSGGILVYLAKRFNRITGRSD